MTSTRLVGRRRNALTCLGAITLWLCGCASAPAPVLLSLPGEEIPRLPRLATLSAPGPAVLVRRVQVPEYMSTQRVRYRSGPDTLAEWPNTLWAERIETAMSRAFSLALQIEMPGVTVCDARCDGQEPSATVTVDLLRLDFVRKEKRLSTNAAIRIVNGPASAAWAFETSWRSDRPTVLDDASGQAEATLGMLRELAAATAGALQRAQLDQSPPKQPATPRDGRDSVAPL